MGTLCAFGGWIYFSLVSLSLQKLPCCSDYYPYTGHFHLDRRNWDDPNTLTLLLQEEEYSSIERFSFVLVRLKE
jgi:hypothetical protein